MSARASGPEEWIAALGNDSFRVRENATQQLTFYPLSNTLRESLKTLTGSPDPEIRLRAEKSITVMDSETLDTDEAFTLAMWNDRYNVHGMIDDVRIYKRALPPGEIKALHASSRSQDPEE